MKNINKEKNVKAIATPTLFLMLLPLSDALLLIVLKNVIKNKTQNIMNKISLLPFKS